jgi:hypothetical protein
MENNIYQVSKKLSNNPLGIIALFIVFIYAFASSVAILSTPGEI